MKKTFSVILLLTMLLTFIGCGETKNMMMIDGEDFSASIDGDTAVLSLSTNCTTGYKWIVEGETNVFEITEGEYIPNETTEDIVGSGGTQKFNIKAKKEGKATVILKYTQNRETEVDIDTGLIIRYLSVEVEKNKGALQIKSLSLPESYEPTEKEEYLLDKSESDGSLGDYAVVGERSGDIMSKISGGEIHNGVENDNAISHEPGTLTAGAWNDNENFDFFKSVLEREEWKALSEKWSMRPAKRFRVQLTDGQTSCKNVNCTLKQGDEILGCAVTDSDGNAYIYYDLKGDSSYIPDNIIIGDIGLPVTEADIENGGMAIDCKAGIKYNNLDLMFVIDTTGSMGDELQYLKAELDDVIDRVKSDNTGISIRIGFTLYRDEGDEYVVRDYPFNSDIEDARKFLDQQFPDGGGDYPEAVDKALESSLNAEWREDSVKLMFLVLDAGAHEGTGASLAKSYRLASKKGIRIIPVASSGVDTETEFLMRTASALSGGTYLFLTDDSGVGESHLEPTVGDYDVKMLNDMIVNIINGYCR
ncbi:MAG: protease inhibitor I42 family protein [Clostridia bacterium]|nr:protease inhibitor I42 family protein [Clostridia bacterium]